MLPCGWNETHDKFICYLESHAPLTGHKHIPKDEEHVPRYTYHQMLYMLDKKFPDFRKEVSSLLLQFSLRITFPQTKIFNFPEHINVFAETEKRD
jgi:hypothetical protein